jgi:hypothetical protein
MQIVLLITPHRLNIFLRFKIQNYTTEYALSDGIWVHIISVKIWGARQIFLKKVKFTPANIFFYQKTRLGLKIRHNSKQDPYLTHAE